MDGLPGWPSIPTSDSGYRLNAGSWGRFLDGGGEAGSSGVVVALESIPCTATPLLTAGSIRVIQGGELVGRWAAFHRRTTLVV